MHARRPCQNRLRIDAGFPRTLNPLRDYPGSLSLTEHLYFSSNDAIHYGLGQRKHRVPQVASV